jgi:hypothetical protein
MFGYNSVILDLSTTWKWFVRFMPWSLYPSLHAVGKGKFFLFSLQGMKPWFISHPACGPSLYKQILLWIYVICNYLYSLHRCPSCIRNTSALPVAPFLWPALASDEDNSHSLSRRSAMFGHILELLIKMELPFAFSALQVICLFIRLDNPKKIF